MSYNENNIAPIKFFEDWYLEAKKFELNNPNACCLATSDSSGFPSARMILIKSYDERGFTFFTNLHSRKAEDFSKNIKAALCFHWKSTEKQVRIEGSLMDLPEEESNKYFETRDRNSQIGAWVSKQSKVINGGMKKLEQEFFLQKNKFADKKIPRPPFWSGKIVVPEKIEFWKSKEHRLHERILFTAFNNKWKKEYLYP